MNQILVGKNRDRLASGAHFLPAFFRAPPAAPTAPDSGRKERKAVKSGWLWIAVIALLPATVGALLIFFPQQDGSPAALSEPTMAAEAPALIAAPTDGADLVPDGVGRAAMGARHEFRHRYEDEAPRF